MEGGAGKGLECQKTMDGKGSNGNGSEKAIPSCCLKAMASAPELEAKCHSTVVSGWFSESHSCSGHYLWFFPQIFIYFCCTWRYLGKIVGLNSFILLTPFSCFGFYRESQQKGLF